jgi:copper chaperone CopZ
MSKLQKYKGEKMKTVSYEVPAINCMHCVHTIKTELGELPGVVSVDADAMTKKVNIQFEPPATQEAIENLLIEIDYPVKK